MSDHGIEVTVETGEDGVPVVFVDTTTGPLRIRLNDGLVWSGDPESRRVTVEESSDDGLYLQAH